MALWVTPGHPGTCPKCGSTRVRWRWKPDLHPTREAALCFDCGWHESRAYQPKK